MTVKRVISQGCGSEDKCIFDPSASHEVVILPFDLYENWSSFWLVFFVGTILVKHVRMRIKLVIKTKHTVQLRLDVMFCRYYQGWCIHTGCRKWFDGYGNDINHYDVAFIVNTTDHNWTPVGVFTVKRRAAPSSKLGRHEKIFKALLVFLSIRPPSLDVCIRFHGEQSVTQTPTVNFMMAEEQKFLRKIFIAIHPTVFWLTSVWIDLAGRFLSKQNKKWE